MDLYSLPKDMLVKLVATIREDLQNEMINLQNENTIKDNIIKEMLRISKPLKLKILKCDVKGCSKFSVISIYEYNDIVKRCDSFNEGQFCGTCYCDVHSSNFTKYMDKEFRHLSILNYCNICKENNTNNNVCEYDEIKYKNFVWRNY